MWRERDNLSPATGTPLGGGRKTSGEEEAAQERRRQQIGGSIEPEKIFEVNRKASQDVHAWVRSTVSGVVVCPHRGVATMPRGGQGFACGGTAVACAYFPSPATAHQFCVLLASAVADTSHHTNAWATTTR